jgi:hypothetical protein
MRNEIRMFVPWTERNFPSGGEAASSVMCQLLIAWEFPQSHFY